MNFIYEHVYDQFISVNLRCLSFLPFLKVGEKDTEGVVQSSADAVCHTDKILLISWWANFSLPDKEVPIPMSSCWESAGES